MDDRAILLAPNGKGNTIILKAIIKVIEGRFAFLQSQSIDICSYSTKQFQMAKPCTSQTIFTRENHFIEVSNFSGTNVVFESIRIKRTFSQQTAATQLFLVQLLNVPNSELELQFLDSFIQPAGWECMWACIFYKVLQCQQYEQEEKVDNEHICTFTPDFPSIKQWILDALESDKIVSNIPFLDVSRKPKVTTIECIFEPPQSTCANVPVEVLSNSVGRVTVDLTADSRDTVHGKKCVGAPVLSNIVTVDVTADSRDTGLKKCVEATSPCTTTCTSTTTNTNTDPCFNPSDAGTTTSTDASLELPTLDPLANSCNTGLKMCIDATQGMFLMLLSVCTALFA